MVFPLVGALINGATATLNVASGTFGAWAALHSDQHQAEIAQDIQGHSVRLQRSMALREDIRDLRKLEVETVLTSMTVGSIMLGCCFAVFTEGFPPSDAVSAWSDIWLFNIAWSICLTFLSIWLASVYQVCVSKFARALLLEEYRIYLPSENEIRNAGGPSLWDRVKALQTLPTEGKDVDDAMIDSKEFYAETQININEHFKEQINRYIPLKEFSDKYLRAGGTALIASVVCTLGARLETSQWFRIDVFMLCVFAAPVLFSVTATAFYHAREGDSTRPSFDNIFTLAKEKSKKHFRSAGGWLRTPFKSRGKRNGRGKGAHEDDEKQAKPPCGDSTRAPSTQRTCPLQEDISKSSAGPIFEAREEDTYQEGNSPSLEVKTMHGAERVGVYDRITGGVLGDIGHNLETDRDDDEEEEEEECCSSYDDESSVIEPRMGCLPLDNCAASVPPMTSRHRNVEGNSMHNYPTAIPVLASITEVEEGRVARPPPAETSSSLGEGKQILHYSRMKSQATAILVPTETPCSKDSQRVQHTMRHFHRLLWMLVVATFIATLIHIVYEAVTDTDSVVAKLKIVSMNFPPFFEPIAGLSLNDDSLYMLSSYRLMHLRWGESWDEPVVDEIHQLVNETKTLFVHDDKLYIVQKQTAKILPLSNTTTAWDAPISDITSLVVIGQLVFIATEDSKRILVYDSVEFGRLMYTITHPCPVVGLADASLSIDTPRVMVLLACERLFLWDVSTGNKVKEWKLDNQYTFSSVAFSQRDGVATITGVRDSKQMMFNLPI